jgi:hypothetical protein
VWDGRLSSSCHSFRFVKHAKGISLRTGDIYWVGPFWWIKWGDARGFVLYFSTLSGISSTAHWATLRIHGSRIKGWFREFENPLQRPILLQRYRNWCLPTYSVSHLKFRCALLQCYATEILVLHFTSMTHKYNMQYAVLPSAPLSLVFDSPPSSRNCAP